MGYRDCERTAGVVCDKQTECVRCGWNPAEAGRRLGMIRDGLLEVGPSGKLRLQLKRNKKKER